MKIHASEIEFLREEVKNCHKIIKELQKKREFVGLTDTEKAELWEISRAALPRYATYATLIETKLKEKNNA